MTDKQEELKGILDIHVEECDDYESLLVDLEKWITQNYIPREDVEGLKMEKVKLKGKYHFASTGCNMAIDEINQIIDELLNK